MRLCGEYEIEFDISGRQNSVFGCSSFAQKDFFFPPSNVCAHFPWPYGRALKALVVKERTNKCHVSFNHICKSLLNTVHHCINFSCLCVFFTPHTVFTNQDSSNFHGKRLYINKALVTLNYRHIHKLTFTWNGHSCHFMNF